MQRSFVPILLTNALAVLLFTILFIVQGNAEFILYILVIAFFAGAIILSLKHVAWPPPVLWGLTLWAILHMAGGGIRVGEGVLYSLVLLPIISEPYLILKYDQVVHVIGFLVATLVVWVLLRPHLKPRYGRIAIPLVVIMAGLGLGAMNEIVEFFVTVLVPETNVGGYENTSLDLVADLVGAMIAWTVIRFRIIGDVTPKRLSCK